MAMMTLSREQLEEGIFMIEKGANEEVIAEAEQIATILDELGNANLVKSFRDACRQFATSFNTGFNESNQVMVDSFKKKIVGIENFQKKDLDFQSVPDTSYPVQDSSDIL